MQVKSYLGKTIAEATSKVKQDLGPEAMILSTRKIRGKGKAGMVEIEATGASAAPPGESPTELQTLRQELHSIKQLVWLANRTASFSEKVISNPGILSLYARLIRNGVKDHYARTFLQRGGAFEEDLKNQPGRVKEETVAEIKKAIAIKTSLGGRDEEQVAAAFIGTTGVGKTTTIAKLAARLMLKQKKKVGLLSVDNYRVGAVEHLKTYANILGIPCFPCFVKKDLICNLRRLQDKDIILIDTAGQSHYNTERLKELKGIFDCGVNIRNHLLLSITTAENEMHRAAVSFSLLKPESYIFSKVDEAENCGAVLNQIMKLNLPVSYITTGQSVPEDIEKADRRRLVSLLLGRN